MITAAVIGREQEQRAIASFLDGAADGPGALVLSGEAGIGKTVLWEAGIEEALEIFEELGARLWAEKARAELGRISGRRPADEELTETERRVAELAAHGRTNKEIAAELYMGVSTVEAHLSRVYRKLGVRRAELAGRLVIPVGDGADA